MSPSNQQNSPADSGNVVSIDASEAKRILTELRALRQSIVDAWQQRAVILTAEEQQLIRDEIRQTCGLLIDLAARD